MDLTWHHFLVSLDVAPSSLRSPDRGAERLTDQECHRAWMLDLSGANGVESFKSKASVLSLCHHLNLNQLTF